MRFSLSHIGVGSLVALLFAASHCGHITAYDRHGEARVVASKFDANAMCVGHNGNIYATDPLNKQV